RYCAPPRTRARVALLRLSRMRSPPRRGTHLINNQLFELLLVPARAPRAATRQPRHRAWLKTFAVRCSLPRDPPVGGHSCNGRIGGGAKPSQAATPSSGLASFLLDRAPIISGGSEEVVG